MIAGKGSIDGSTSKSYEQTPDGEDADGYMDSMKLYIDSLNKLDTRN